MGGRRHRQRRQGDSGTQRATDGWRWAEGGVVRTPCTPHGRSVAPVLFRANGLQLNSVRVRVRVRARVCVCGCVCQPPIAQPRRCFAAQSIVASGGSLIPLSETGQPSTLMGLWVSSPSDPCRLHFCRSSTDRTQSSSLCLLLPPPLVTFALRACDVCVCVVPGL